MFKRLGVFAFAACMAVCFAGCGGGSPSPSVTVSASSSTVDGTDAVTLTGTVTNDKNSAGVTWSVSGGGALSNTTTTSATYTAPAATSSQQSITITATSVADTTKTGTLTITVPAAPAVTTTSANLTGAVGSTFSVKLQASGGIAPFTWALGTGTTLPACLSLKSDGTLTTASGTAPTASCAGTYTNLTFKATDSGTATPLSVTSSALTVTIAAAPAITFGAAPIATGTFNVAYASAVAASGGAGPLTYSLASGSLPPNLHLNSATGAIAGTPNAADIGTWTFAVTAADAFGDSAASSNYTITISYPALTVNPVTPPTGYASSVYTSTSLNATGGNGGPYTWTWAAANGSSLPPGLNISSAGVITGTPTTPGTYSVVLTATDSASNAGHATITITVKPGITITPIVLPTGYAGSSYPTTGNTLSASGGAGAPYTWSWAAAGGSILPAGLSIGASTGAITGTPTTVGTYSVVITATDSATPANSASITLSITIGAGVSVTPPTLTNAYNGTLYTSAAFTASGGSGAPYAWSATGLTGSGLSINGSSGVISGTPTNSGSTTVAYHASVTATDSSGNNQASVNATINVEATVAVTSPATLPGVVVGVNPNYQLTASGGSGSYTTWTVTSGASSLTAVGLSVSSSGVLTGSNPQAGTANFAVTVTDSESHTSTAANLSVTVSSALTITTAILPAGNAGASYSATLVAGGGSGTYTNWQVTSMTGAANLAAISLNLNTSTGAISGTPSASGTYSITFQVTDSASHTASKTLSLTIYPALTLPASNSLPGGYANVAYSGSIQGSGGSGSLSIAISSALSPSNGTLAAGASGATVSLSGTPTAANTESISVKLTDTTTTNFITQSYSFSITTATAPVLPASSLPNATVSQAYGPQTITATGGVGPNYTWTVNSTVLTNNTPMSVGNGITAQTSGNNQLSISGTPSSTTQVQFPVTVKDNTTNLTSSAVTYTITVNSSGSQVSGSITTICPSSGSLPTFSVQIANSGNTFTQTQSTDVNGNFTFSNVPNGTYTITPSISGPSSAFYPATQSVTVNNSNVTSLSFNVSLGYTVSGTVAYSGSSSGRIFVTLSGGNCGGGSGLPGTSIASPGTYTIRGVPQGTYTVSAGMDTLGTGHPNAVDPNGQVNATVNFSNASAANVTLVDPSPSVPSSGPRLNIIAPASQGVVIVYGGITNSNNIEAVTSYEVQWSTSSSFTTTAGDITFAANGTKGAPVWILNSGTAGLTGSFVDGTAYYFRARGKLGSSTTGWRVYGAPTAVTGGQLTSVANCNSITGGSSCVTVTGSVTIPSGVTVAGPLYVGFFSNTSGVFGTRISNPVVGANAYTVYVPTGKYYFNFAVVDQDNNGLIGNIGDLSNINGSLGNTNIINISGNVTNQNITLSGSKSGAVVVTQYFHQTCQNCSSDYTGYSLGLGVYPRTKLPVAVTLTSGPNVIAPVDLTLCSDCGDLRAEYTWGIGSAMPTIGDTYALTVTYSDATTENLTAQVTGVLGSSQLATNLSPSGNTSNLQPTFSWTYPANPANYVYQFNLFPNNGNDIWDVPGNGSVGNGFFYSDVSSGLNGSLVWNVDPTNSGNTTSVGSLSSATTYNWAITTVDSNNNSAQQQVWFVP